MIIFNLKFADKFVHFLKFMCLEKVNSDSSYQSAKCADNSSKIHRIIKNSLCKSKPEMHILKIFMNMSISQITYLL